ncbi:MAG: branched-chain amino acid aminotransferase [Bacteroidetes bacterium]|nr:branched-chain amino acid aminotransferase [Bacteroidota bacterium]
MEMTETIRIHKTNHSTLADVDWSNLEFGKYNADHMLVCDFLNGAWESPKIIPFANLSLSPVTLSLHYGQTIFEGMKAFRMIDKRISIFRPEKHYERFVRSAERMCMEVIPREIFMEGLHELIKLDGAWVPSAAGSALYIRPFIIATEAKLGVKISEAYKFLIVSGPVGSLYQKPISVKVETKFVRASRGGTGCAKCGGNYGAAFYPTKKAREQGYDQVLWTDGKENKYIEESGTMNAMFVIDNKLVSPPSSDSILDGVTRDSFITLAKQEGITVEERPVSIDELKRSFRDNTITEAFGVGTAAVATQIKLIGIDNVHYNLPTKKESIAELLKAKLDGIRTGKIPDVNNWNKLLI